ncbi:MAG: DUF2975 domain-containing protein [Proteobacteria bacterium]|nr:DUF2975 domain-containing protein [Pseudomonadota bacterium]
MAPVSFLPKLFRWVFSVLMVILVLSSVAIVAAILIDPKLPPGTHFGPVTRDVGGQPASFVLQANGGDSDFTAHLFNGTINIFVKQAGGLVEVVKHHGLPVMLIDTIFLAVLFELLRRLFRNVGRGESFTRQTVQLVQLVGGALIAFSLVSAFVEHWFVQSVYLYLADHATATISGSPIQLPRIKDFGWPHGDGGSPVFFSGLLVLALSEVFRQGLALKTENELTV